ncbi:MAG: DUF2089 domain-containing protein [Candidatus Zixiibacteriota bacterium]|nr:MAG: DUF2089 domain-containing protein [candidate division Zixibacteria bacterium]
MSRDWAYLTKLTGDKSVTVERVAIDGEEMAIEGRFELPPLARLTAEDQVFVAVFVKSHGSIKQMEKHFGVSYPTIKGRLNRIAGQLDFVEVEATTDSSDALDRLERGELSVDEAIDELRKGDSHE